MKIVVKNAKKVKQESLKLRKNNNFWKIVI